MASPPKAGRSPEPKDAPGDAASSAGVRQRIRRRVAETQAALVLERAGEVEEAARVFEAAEAHDQAASLRLEHARALRDPQERLDALRESCARAVGDSPEVRALHRALARALVNRARAAPAAARPATLTEAAGALERAGEPALAGELYENLGNLSAAARCYERAGEVARLEEVLLRQEREASRARAGADARARADAAWARGERRTAVALLEAHLAAVRAQPGASAQTALARHLARLRGLLRAPGRVLALRVSGEPLTICLAPEADLGRAPDADVILDEWGISRRHARLHVAQKGESLPALFVTDLGSRGGTFLDGASLDPGLPVPVDGPATLALAAAPPMHLAPVRDPATGAACGALLELPPPRGRWLLLPGGGPLLLPDLELVGRLQATDSAVTLTLRPDLAARLGAENLPRGASVDLLPGDRLVLDPGGAAVPLEVRS